MRENFFSGQRIMTKIPFEILKLEDDSYHILVNVVINKYIEGKFVIDTGASKTILDSSLELKEEQKLGEEPFSSGLGGELAINFCKVDRLSIGTFTMENMTLATVDLSTVNSAYEKVVSTRVIGLLGSDLLLKYGAIINYREAYLQID